MRVCLISGTYPDIHCGVGFHTYYLSRELARMGCEVHVVTTKNASVVGGENDVVVHAVIENWGLGLFKTLRREMGVIRPDVIHLQHPTAIRGKLWINFIFIYFKLFIPSSKIIMTLHELTEASALGKTRNLFLLLSAPTTILPNPNDYDYAVKVFPWKRNRFYKIPIGPTLPLPRIGEPVLKSNMDIVAPGFLDPQKGIEVLIEALAEVVHKYPGVNLKLLTSIDVSNQYHESIIKMIEALNLSENVLTFKNLDSQKIADILSKSRLAVLPYKRGVSLRRSTLLEVLTAGLPTIIARGRATPKELLESGAVVTFAAGDTKELIRLIFEILENDLFSMELAKRGLVLAKESSWETIGERTLNLYKSLSCAK